MSKRRVLVLGLTACLVVAGLFCGALYLAETGSGALITICLVGLGPALAAVAMVGAMSIMAPPQVPALPVSTRVVDPIVEIQG
jgi:hypothetical protein